LLQLVRELMPSLVKTLRRWYSTVRGLMNSRADLGVGQGFAGQFGDLGLLRGEAAGGLDGAFAGGLAGGSQFASGALGDINRGSGWERTLNADVKPQSW
jgi:hypothetical protein